MKLNELHIPYPAARTPGHGNAIAGSGIGVAGIAVNLTDTARCQYDGLRGNGFNVICIDI
jgi:hypothetical protein